MITWSHLSFFKFVPICLRFFDKCCFQLSLLSRCKPKCVATLLWGISTLFKVNGRHCPLRREKVTCVDFFSFTLIFHLFCLVSRRFIWPYRLVKATTGATCDAKIAVLSANVLTVVTCVIGRLAVYSTYSIYIVPECSPVRLQIVWENRWIFPLLTLVLKWRSFR